MEKKREKQEEGSDEEESSKKQKLAGFDVELCKNLLVAAESGDVESVKRLLEDARVDSHYVEECDEDSEPLTAFRLACSNGHVEVVRALLPGADEGLDEGFCDAVKAPHLEVLQLLLSDPRVDPAACDNLAVGCASEN